MQVEEINALDEAKILGYFETVKSVFLLKLVLLVSVVKERNGKYSIDPAKIPDDAIDSAKALIDDPIFYKALRRGNEELYLNYAEDMITGLLTSSWIVFEQITKDLVKPDYATQPEELSVSYQNSLFQFSKREKKDLELFYYIRNANQHYNGSY